MRTWIVAAITSGTLLFCSYIPAGEEDPARKAPRSHESAFTQEQENEVAVFDWPEALRTIEAVEGNDAASRLLGSILYARVYGDSERGDENSLSKPENTVWMVKMFVAEVMSGSFHQFFFNGGYCDELPGALELVGADQILALLHRAIRILSPEGPVPTDLFATYELLDKVGFEAFNELDREFYDLPESAFPDLTLYAYRNAESFRIQQADIDAAMEQLPYMLFPADRKHFGRFDLDAAMIEVSGPGYARKIPLSELDSLIIVKTGSKPGSSGLLYRLTTAETTVDVPYFARGEGAHQTIIWYFPESTHRLVAFAQSLREARSPSPMKPIVLWTRSDGNRYPR